jgi:hypothetical protein
MLVVSAHLVWPDDDDPVEFTVLGLLNRHRSKWMLAGPSMSPTEGEFAPEQLG